MTNEEKKTPLKKMGPREYEKDTKLQPYTRKKINPRNWKDLVEDDDDFKYPDESSQNE